MESVLDCLGTVLGDCFIIYTINYVLTCMRLEIAMEFGSTKWNFLVSRPPTDSPLPGFGTVKNSLGLHEFDQKRPCDVCMKLFEVNDLNFVTPPTLHPMGCQLRVSHFGTGTL